MSAVGAGGHAKLSRDAIVDAALALVDEDGLESLSMRRLAARLGVEAMSLYNHVDGKAALLDALVERLIVDTELDFPDDEPWTEAMMRTATAIRSLAHAHPRAYVLLATRPPATTRSIVHMEPLHAVLARAGFDGGQRLLIMQILFTFLNGYLLAEVGTPPGQGDVPEPDGIAAYSGLPEEARYARDAAASIDAPGWLARQFETAVRLVIGGLERLEPAGNS
jgi:AcrR family transcriptional regulator